MLSRKWLRFKFISQKLLPTWSSLHLHFMMLLTMSVCHGVFMLHLKMSPKSRLRKLPFAYACTWTGILIACKRDLHAGPAKSFVKRRH